MESAEVIMVPLAGVIGWIFLTIGGVGSTICAGTDGESTPSVIINAFCLAAVIFGTALISSC